MMDENPKPKIPSAKHVGAAVGGALGGVIDIAAGSVGKLVGSAIRLPGRHRGNHKHETKPGAPPGIEHIRDSNIPPPPGVVQFRCIDYGPAAHQAVEVPDLDTLFTLPRPEGTTYRWINIDGLHPYVIRKVCEVYGFHTLSAEDIIYTSQRPKVEPYDDELFVVARMVRLVNDCLISEQLCIFLMPGLVVTFQETWGDVFDPIRQRLADPAMRIRQNDASFLVYALLDAIVDHGFPILERYGDLLEEIEADVLERPTNELQSRILTIKRELSLLRRYLWPTREVITALMQEKTPFISATTRTFLRDAYEHTVQLVDIVETFREMASGLTDLYMSAISNRMNEVMKVLTIMASLFIPITFLAGVYGMNFDHFPELHWKYAYVAFWAICAAVTVGLLAYFWRKGWIGKG